MLLSIRRMLRTIGSLWFAAVLLVLTLVAMACATVYESMRGTEAALWAFYHSRWFEVLLALVAVNILAAMLARFPYTRWQFGFVLTHLALLLIFAGALVTRHWGVNGQVAIVEGSRVDEVRLADQPVLRVANQSTNAQSVVDLSSRVFQGFESVDGPLASMVRLDGLHVQIERYVPDSTLTQRVVDDGPFPRPAVEVSLSAGGAETPRWVWEHRKERIGPAEVALRIVKDEKELAELLAPLGLADAEPTGKIRVEIGERTVILNVADCLDVPAPIPRTVYTVKVLRYLPHAIVGAGGKVTSASNRPVNPAIEVELSSSETIETRLAFAKFPDFDSLHGRRKIEDVRIVFDAGAASAPEAPIEILAGPGDELHVRFAPPGGETSNAPLTVGEPVATPWPGLSFAVLRRFARARVDRAVEPVLPPRETRIPAVQVKLSSAKATEQLWIQKYEPRPANVDGVPFTLSFADKTIPLGFSIALERFRVGYYPGERRPRSFESTVVIEDPRNGTEQRRLISMNNPTEYGGFTFFQSSYRLDRGPATSILSVARDPGQAIVFAGYIGGLAGMVIVFGLRIGDQRRTAKLAGAGAAHGAPQ